MKESGTETSVFWTCELDEGELRSGISHGWLLIIVMGNREDCLG